MKDKRPPLPGLPATRAGLAEPSAILVAVRAGAPPRSVLLAAVRAWDAQLTPAFRSADADGAWLRKQLAARKAYYEGVARLVGVTPAQAARWVLEDDPAGDRSPIKIV